jgi:hypothetical protein
MMTRADHLTYDVTKDRAQAMMDDLRCVLDPDWEPALYEPPGHHADAWVIASEHGPENWPQLATAHINGDRQTGLYAEALTHRSIALFPGRCGCGQLRKADWNLQLWLERGQDDDLQKLCLHLRLCDQHKGTAEQHVPPGWTMAGRSYLDLRGSSL